MKTLQTSYKVFSSYGNSKDVNISDLEGLRILERKENKIIFLFHNVRYEADILEIDDAVKNMKVLVNDQVLHLNLQDSLDQLIDRMGLADISELDSGEIYSPMPGLVLEIMVSVGDTIKKGDSLLVLEAMKMENMIQSSTDGIVKAIKCTEKNTVNKGDLLVVIEP